MYTHPDTERVSYDREALGLLTSIDEVSLKTELGDTIRIIRFYHVAGQIVVEVDLGCWGTEWVPVSKVFPKANLCAITSAVHAWEAVRDRATQVPSYSMAINIAMDYLTDVLGDWELEILRKRPNLYLAHVGYALCWWLVENAFPAQDRSRIGSEFHI